MPLKADVLTVLRERVGPIVPAGGRRGIYQIGRWRVNVRTAHEKSGDKYWFDVTPSYCAPNGVDFFVYACGSADRVYVFPRQTLSRLIAGASLGGQKQVPNFTIYTKANQLEPAGRSDAKQDIRQYLNNVALLT